MKEWNILATSRWGQERYLLRLLRSFGDFRGSGYRDVILGNVEDVYAFLEAVEMVRQEDPGKLRSLGQIVPIQRNFQFEVSDFEDKAKEAVAPFIDQLDGTRFFVRVVRRGHKGEISSQETEHDLDGYILESLKSKGKEAEVNIEEFEKMVVLETIGDLAGVGLIAREMEEQYPFIKLK